MAVWSIVDFADVQKDGRWDPEYFQPAFSALRETLKDGMPLSKYILSAQRGQSPEYDENGCVPVIRTVNVRDLMFSDARTSFVQPWFYESATKGKIEERDIVVTSTGLGTLGRTFCNTTSQRYFADGHITVLTPKPDADECFLTAVLQSRIGCMQLEQKQRGSSGQIEIYPADILSILIPKVPEQTRRKTSETWRAAVQLIQDADSFYPQAEAELLQRLGWNEIAAAPRELFYIADWDEMKTQGRADPEFFQPYFERLRKQIEDKGGLELGKACALIARGVQPEFDSEGDVLALDSKCVRPQGVEPAHDERVNRDFYNRPSTATARVKFEDVLLNSTGRGTLGRAACYLRHEDAVCDNHVAMLRPDQKQVLPVYLALFLNSPAGLAQSERFQTGSSGQLELYPQHIAQFQIFVPRNRDGSIDLAWQQGLAAQVLEASEAKTRAREKLEEAKTLVEAVIKSF